MPRTSIKKRLKTWARAVYRRLPRAFRRQIEPGLRAFLAVARRRATPETSALLLSVTLAFVVLPLVLFGLAFSANSWWLRALLAAAAVCVAIAGATATTRRLFNAVLGRLYTNAGEGSEFPPTGHSYRVTAGWQPYVTVVVAAYNDNRFLGEALASLIDQDFVDFECVVVDDGSTDLTLDVAHAFAAVDERFRVIHHEGNAGLSAARNTGLSYADAPWVTFLDADDFLWPSALSQRLEAVTDDPECAGAFCDWRPVPEDASPKDRTTKPRDLTRATFPESRWETPFIASAPILRTSIVRSLGGFAEGLHSAEDFEFYLRLLRAGYWINYARYVGIGYRQVQGSMIRGNPALHVEVVRSVINMVESEIDADTIPGSVAPYTRPLSYYVRETAALRRQLRFLALAHLTGRAEQVERVTAQMDLQLLRHPLPFDPIEDAYEYAVQRLRLWDPRYIARREELRLELQTTLRPLLHDVRDSPSGGPAPPAAGETEGLRRRTVITKGGRTSGVVELGKTPRLVGIELEHFARHTVVLVPQSRYHVDELGPLAEELARRGIPTSFMVPDNTPPSVLTEMAKYTQFVLRWDASLPDRCPIAGVVVLNDWGPARLLIECAERHGISTFAKVEGVQDFTDVDTGRQRLPYRRARYVLGQGPSDAKSLADRDVFIVGNSRLERIWLEPSSRLDASQPLLVNFNFTYNVLTQQADSWILSVQDGIDDADREFVVSLHPAQKHSDLVRNPTPQPIRHELTRSAALVSRFSTVIYEAMARGVPVIYHNPHGEQVLDFQNPRGAFLKTTSRVELRDAIHRLNDWQVDYRERCTSFFAQQIDVDPDRPSGVRAAEAIVGLL